MAVTRIRPPRLTLRRAMVVSALIATICAVSSLASIGLLPPKLTSRHQHVAAAATAMMVDGPRSLVLDRDLVYREWTGYVQRATLFGNVIASRPVLEDIGKRIGVPSDRIYAVARLTSDVTRIMREPSTEQRASQLLGRKARYRLDLQADPRVPRLNVYAQAPTPAEAKALADASIAALRDYLRKDQAARGDEAGEPFVIRQLGPARGAIVNEKILPQLAGLTFMVVFALSLALLLGTAHVRRSWVSAGTGPKARRYAREFGRLAPPRRRAHDNWPHTTRVMPWMIAGFLALLWLVPFNTIQLGTGMPFDLKLDRLVLPIIFGTWLLSLVTGGPAAPRVRVTPIHVGVGILVAAAAVSIVVNVEELNQAMEFDQPVKKLVLLCSYGLLFVIVASSIRANEVPAFMTFSLALGVVCALGIVWEYRFLYNVFYDVAHRVLSSVFQVGLVDPHEVDDIGRRMTRGPSEHPLEAVAMLSMAFPVALVGIINSKERGKRIMYAIAAVLLLAAAISTYRKSALLAPMSIILTLAWFRRRDLLKLAPLGALSMVAIHVLSPGALGSVFVQLAPNRLGVSTIGDRSSDYDAVRPDVWTHLLFGRGYGSYDHVTYRVLDSEVLSRLVDTGVVGLLSLVLLVVVIVATARHHIGERDSRFDGPALAVAAAAIAFLVLAFLFDVTSFPHTPYLLLLMAGLLAVVLAQRQDEETWALERELVVGPRPDADPGGGSDEIEDGERLTRRPPGDRPTAPVG